jgi:2-hydroxychromene-2-carboxylate isomerase
MLVNPVTVALGRDYHKSLVRMTKLRGARKPRFSVRHLIIKLIEEYLRSDDDGKLFEPRGGQMFIHRLDLTEKTLRTVVEMAREQGFDPEALLRAIVENRIRNRQPKKRKAARKT